MDRAIPEYTFAGEGGKIEIHILQKGESLRNLAARECSPLSHFCGPCAVIAIHSFGNIKQTEYELDDPNFWKIIFESLKVGHWTIDKMLYNVPDEYLSDRLRELPY